MAMVKNIDKGNRPYYHKLYADMIKRKYPEKAKICESYLQRANWTALDVMTVNRLLFGAQKDKEGIAVDQKHKAYDYESIKQILADQKRNKLSNTKVAIKYQLSRNTVAKWKKCFPELT